ncbi:MAG TPA: DUF389 domain-containing protein [Gaiellaceae bacterium]|nr:DUF389 domain-containing protein [Gaiellaceae bacterium]
MLHLRLVVPSGRAGAVLELLDDEESVANLIHLPGAARAPEGDVVLCDVAREDASIVLERLRALGLEREGSIAVEEVDFSLSRAADDAERAAAGSPVDAVVWEEIVARTSEEAELSFSFLVFMALATTIAGVGILTDSVILIIGAMIVGPEFGPIAGVCVALVQGRPDLARRSFRALLVGFPTGMTAALVLTAATRAAGTAPDRLGGRSSETFFISHPSSWSVIVALLAGCAGVLSLTSTKSGALIGVLVSVTTIPAAANVGVAAAYGDWGEWRGALLQLAINVAAIFFAGVSTLGVQRAGFARRRRRRPRK